VENTCFLKKDPYLWPNKGCSQKNIEGRKKTMERKSESSGAKTETYII